MVRFELKKIFAKSSNKIALIILLVAIVVISYFAIGSIEYVDSSGNSHTGITAYNRLKEVKNEWKGNITESVLQEVLEENNKIKSSEEYLSKNDTENNIAYSRGQGFSDIKDMINRSFCDFQEYDYYRVDTVTPTELGNFYSNRIDNLKKQLCLFHRCYSTAQPAGQMEPYLPRDSFQFQQDVSLKNHNES